MNENVLESNKVTKRRKYKKDFLEKVIAKIDFDAPIPISNKGPTDKIYIPIKSRFPITETKKMIAKEFLISENIDQQRRIEENEWYYYGKDREKYLKVSARHMVVEYKKYEHYENLREDFLSVSDAIFDSYPNVRVRRLGLRYIDVIKLDKGEPTDWNKYLIDELNTIFKIADDRKTISRAFHLLEFNYGDALLRFQFGMFNPDYPATIKQKQYTLDFDMYCEMILEKSDIRESLDRFHEKLNNSFEEVITDNLRNIMEVIDE